MNGTSMTFTCHSGNLMKTSFHETCFSLFYSLVLDQDAGISCCCAHELPEEPPKLISRRIQQIAKLISTNLSRNCEIAF